MLNIIKHDIDLSLYSETTIIAAHDEAAPHWLSGRVTLSYSPTNDCGKPVNALEIAVYDFDKTDPQDIEVALGLLFDAFCILAKACDNKYCEEAADQIDKHSFARRAGAMLLMVNEDINDSVYIETDIVHGVLTINAVR